MPFEPRLPRRQFIRLIGAAAAAWPPTAHGQPADRMRRLGVLMGIAERDPEGQARIAVLQEALAELGWTEGRNLQLEIRRIPGEADAMRTFARELIEGKPDLLVAVTTPAVIALRQETKAIPIVFVQVVDPLGRGFVSSLGRPGGNITGFVTFEFSMGGKWLETLKQVAPQVARVGLIFNPQTAPFSESFIRVIEAAAPSLALVTTALPIGDAQLETVIAAFAEKPNGGLIALPDLFNTSHRDTLVSLAERYRLPAVYPFRYFVTAGGLISDGVATSDLYRRAAGYVDRILKGANPGELPVQGPSKFELVINLKTANTLGLTIPQMLLATADEVIE